MNTHLKHPPLRRVLRTALTLLLALPVLVPGVVAVLALFGVHVNEAALLAIAGTTVLLVTRVRAGIAQAGDAPVLRTLVQLLPAVAAVVASGLTDLRAAGWTVDGAKVLAAFGAVHLLLAAIQNALEAKGVVPELGAQSGAPPCVGCEPLGPHGQNPELIDDGEVR
jgi:hypothetical protein